MRRAVRAQDPLPEDRDVVLLGNLRLDFAAHEVTVDGEPIELTPIEFALLSLFAREPRRVFERESIIAKVWGHDYYGDSRTVDTHVRNLRKKIDGANIEVTAVRGVGYKLEL